MSDATDIPNPGSPTMPDATNPPPCPGCGQGDRVEHDGIARGSARARAGYDQGADTDLSHWWCARCMGWLSALPAVSAGPPPADQRVRVVDAEDVPGKRRRK